jgi:phage gp16-like protein
MEGTIMPASNAARAVPAQFDKSSQHRRAMIAKIQIARQQLGMVEDDYRQIVFEQTGKTSLKDASEPQLARVLDVMKAKGFKPLPGKKAASHPMAMKARALWISLYHLNAVHNPAEEALEAFAKRQLGCDRLQWAKQSDAFRLIEALKNMASRNGWLQHNRATGKAFGPVELQASLCAAILIKLKDAGIAPADWLLHDAAWKLCGIENKKADPWTASDYEHLAKALGFKLRTHGKAFASPASWGSSDGKTDGGENG